MDRYVRIKVLPNRPRTEWGDVLGDGTRKVKVAAPAEKGKANKVLLRFLRKEWKVQTKNMEIIMGKNEPLKLIRIRNEDES